MGPSMSSNNLFEQLLYKHPQRFKHSKRPDRLTEQQTFADGVDAYGNIKRLIFAIDFDIMEEIVAEIGDVDIESLSADEIAELTAILQDAAIDEPSTVDTLVQQDFDEVVDNGHVTSLQERPMGRMAAANMIRTKHKMGLNAIPKSKLKVMRIRNRLKNLKRRINAKKYYKQNKAVLKRYNKSYQKAIATGKHRAAIRRKA